jgi:hypothetical protein
VELEVECVGKNGQDDTLDDLQDSGELNKWIIAKRDDSLIDGVEVVSAPSTLDVHRDKWGTVLKHLRRHAISWTTPTTGIHIHLSRSFFSKLDIAKFVACINAIGTRPYIIGLAGRSSPEYAALSGKRLIELLDHSDRHTAVNLRRENVIEVRIFKGTLNLRHLLSDLEFCHALAHWVKLNSLAECGDWGAFMRYVESQGNSYAEFLAYMEKIRPKILELKAVDLEALSKRPFILGEMGDGVE